MPATRLTVSHISGPTIIQTITRRRGQCARVEGPEQTEQFAQLAAAHQHWLRKAQTLDAEKVGVLVTSVAGLGAGDFHVQAEGKLFVRESASRSSTRGLECGRRVSSGDRRRRPQFG